jgi:hypothetical protein
MRLFPLYVGWVGPVVVEAMVDMAGWMLVTGGMFWGIVSPDAALVMISGSTMGAVGSGSRGCVPWSVAM